ncbi:MAG: V-type ATPase 116kDa subunit family protein, partial [Candidatus Thorarchaeota archaeon]
EINPIFRDQFLIELSNLASVHIKPKEKTIITEESEDQGPLSDRIKDLRKNLDNLLKKLNINEYILTELKSDEAKRIEFTANDLPELINHLFEEVNFYNNRVNELQSFVAKGTIELENLKTLKVCYKSLEKLNMKQDSLVNINQFRFRIFTTFSKNLNNLNNLFEFSVFPNFYQTFEVSKDRIGFYIIYPRDKEVEFNGRIRLIHSEEVPIVKKYFTESGIHHKRIDKEISFIENTLLRYYKELNRIGKDNLLMFAGINEIVQNIEEYNWANRQFERMPNNRLILKFFVPSSKLKYVQGNLFDAFKDNITIETIFISKKNVTKENYGLEKIKKKKSVKKIKSDEEPIVDTLEEDEDKSDLRAITPTIMKNFSLVKPFETLTRMYGTPTYSEIDPTPIIAITFPILFGLMFGDIGHGLILIISGLIGALVYRKRGGDIVNFSWIIFFCGWTSFFIGFLYGEFFGLHEVEVFGNILWHLRPISIASIISKILQNLGYIIIVGGIIIIFGVLTRALKYRGAKFLTSLGIVIEIFSLIMYIFNLLGIFRIFIFNITLYNPLGNILSVLYFAIIIGVFHINLGWFIQFLNYWKQHRKFLALSDSLMKILLLTGGTILIFTYGFDIYSWLAVPYPILLVIIPGLLLLILKPFGKLFGISYLKKESYTSLISEGSLETFDTVLSVMSNVASYLRLLALALAHIALLYAINVLVDLIQGEGIVVEIINLIGLIFGNIIVILLEGLLVFLNTLRLHFYEFFFKFFQGSGVGYIPFHLDSEYSIINFKAITEKDIISEEIDKEIETESIREEIEKAFSYISKKYR